MNLVTGIDHKEPTEKPKLRGTKMRMYIPFLAASIILGFTNF